MTTLATVKTIDTLRFLVLAEGTVLAGMTFTVFAAYLARFQRHGGLLPLHVTLISASYLMLTAAVTAEVAAHIGDTTITWRSPMAGLAFALGIAALIVLLTKIRGDDRRL